MPQPPAVGVFGPPPAPAFGAGAAFGTSNPAFGKKAQMPSAAAFANATSPDGAARASASAFGSAGCYGRPSAAPTFFGGFGAGAPVPNAKAPARPSGSILRVWLRNLTVSLMILDGKRGHQLVDQIRLWAGLFVLAPVAMILPPIPMCR